MKIKTTKIKLTTALWLLLGSVSLLIPAHSFAQTVIGSFQNDTGDGWIDWGNLLSITNSANTNKYSFVPGAVPGYTQSLQIAQAGYNQNLAIKLENIPGGLAAFLQNYLLTFTFSVPSSASSGSTAGYSQLYALAINASGYGFNNVSFTNFTETGVTNNNGSSGEQPNFYFGSGSPVQTQTVTVNYSNILSSITATTNSGYIELIFTFNNGGGAPTNYFINNVTLSGAPAVSATTTNFVVDDFSPNGVSPTNPPNYDYYSSAQDYADGDITNVWWNWFGSAFQSLSWDPSSDASNNPNSGSLEINLNWSNGTQFVVWDQGEANDYYALGISALTYTNFQCDVRFAPGSASDTGTAGQAIFGHLRFGDRTSSYGQDWFGAVDVAATNTNWVHVSVSLNAITDTNLLDIQGLIIGIDEGFYSLNLNGISTLWVDNIKFTGPGAVVTQGPPVLKMAAAVPGLRIFAGSSVNNYDREELATVDQSQSWIGGSYPVTYAFTLQDYPANIYQTHIMLVPVNTSGQANMGNAGTVNEYIDYQASNELWMVLAPVAGGVSASVQWKVGSPNANPGNTALTITNATAVGTWKLTFTSASQGTLTAPGASPAAFTISDPNVSTDFANPLVAYFGLQPNSTAGEGEFEDWSNITVTGVTGVQENDTFAADSSLNSIWANNSASLTSLQLVPASAEPAYWVNWSLPAFGYALGTSDNIAGSTVAPYPWMLPEYYNNYGGSGNGTILPGIANQGTNSWVLIPSTCLPTSNGQPGGPIAPTGFFELINPPLQN
jgi:hypothetical protein